MHIDQECRDCLIRLVDLTVELASPEALVQEAARAAALAIIEAEYGPGAIPALIANRFHLAIQTISGNPDPFCPANRRRPCFSAATLRHCLPGFPRPWSLC